MNTLEGLILSYLVNSLWQVPLLSAAAWLIARIVRPLGPVIEHHIVVSALLLQALPRVQAAAPQCRKRSHRARIEASLSGTTPP
jgi:hypothetical protein